MKTFALALGGGGARGLAHIAVVEALDEMDLKPVAIAGTSVTPRRSTPKNSARSSCPKRFPRISPICKFRSR
jgi:hypothetical protein